MPKYTKSVRKNNMRKNKRGRSRRGGYWFYPSPGDDEHAFTKLRNKFSTGSWKFWQKQPEEVLIAPVSSDYPPAEEEPMPEQAQGSLEYPSSETNQPIDNQEEAPMEPSPPMDNQEAPMEPSPPMDDQEAPVEETPETPTGEQELKGGRRRRRQKRTTKKRKRSNMRRRTNKRRRSSKRRSR
jgi:hypothetical protein